MTPASDRPESRYVLEIVAVRDPLHHLGVDRTPEYRLRGLLKGLLRSGGFRCVRITPASIVAPPVAGGVASSSSTKG